MRGQPLGCWYPVLCEGQRALTHSCLGCTKHLDCFGNIFLIREFRNVWKRHGFIHNPQPSFKYFVTEELIPKIFLEASYVQTLLLKKISSHEWVINQDTGYLGTLGYIPLRATDSRGYPLGCPLSVGSYDNRDGMLIDLYWGQGLKVTS